MVNAGWCAWQGAAAARSELAAGLAEHRRLVRLRRLPSGLESVEVGGVEEDINKMIDTETAG